MKESDIEMNDQQAGSSRNIVAQLFKIIASPNNESSVKGLQSAASLQETQIDVSCFLLEDKTFERSPDCLTRCLQLLPNASMMPASDLLCHLVYLVALEGGFVAVQDFEKLSSQLMRPIPCAMYNSKNMSLLASKLPPFSIGCCGESTWVDCLLNVVDVPRVFEADGDYPAKPALLSRLSCLTSGEYLYVTVFDKAFSPGTGSSVSAKSSGQSIEAKSGESTTAAVSKVPSGNLSGKPSSMSASLHTRSYSVGLSIPRYILSPRTSYKEPHQRIQKLDELVLKLRNELFMPLRHYQLKEIGFPIFPALDGLPFEMYDSIFKYLPKASLSALACVSKSFNDLVKDSRHYKKHVHFRRQYYFGSDHNEINL